MKKSILVSAVSLALASSPLWAQTIKSLDFRSGKQLDMGSISELVIQFDQSAGGTNWCGLLVRWGDGQEQTLRIGDDQFKTSPAIVPHTYTKAGNFRVDVEGRPMVRGLRSAVGCDGRPSPVDVVVVDKQAAAAAAAAEAQRQEAERRLREQQAEAERMKAEQARQQAEQARLEAERRQREFAEKELELKRRELQMKEEMLKREEEMRRRQAAPAPAARPAPAPAPAPAAAPAPRPAGPAAVKPADGF